MNRIERYIGMTLLLTLSEGVLGVRAEQAASAEPQAPSQTVQSPGEFVPALPVPRLVKFAGAMKDEQGKARTGMAGLTFAIYKEQEGGAALWVETQNVELDEQGRYTVLLGSSKSEGLPLELFNTGEPRWLGVQVNLAKELEQPRVLLVSVPYALKAADAETLGGKPLSSFVLATPLSGGVVGVGTALNPATEAIGPATIGGGGSQNFVAKFDATGANVINSSLFDNGQVGIGTTTPGALLDVQLTTGAAANALNSKITLNNSSANTGSVVSAFKMTLLDESTAANLSKQPARFVYLRDVSATGGVTAFDAVMTATSFLNANAPYQLRGVNIEGPTMATGTTLDTFYGGYIGSGGGAGTVTNRFALVTEPGAGNVGIGTTGPTQKLEVAGNLKISGSGNGVTFPDGTSISTAGDVQLAVVPSCTTGSQADSVCNTNVSWPVPFADSNYTATCTIEAPQVSTAFVLNYAKSPSGLSVNVANLASGAASGMIDCIGSRGGNAGLASLSLTGHWLGTWLNAAENMAADLVQNGIVVTGTVVLQFGGANFGAMCGYNQPLQVVPGSGTIVGSALSLVVADSAGDRFSLAGSVTAGGLIISGGLTDNSASACGAGNAYRFAPNSFSVTKQ